LAAEYLFGMTDPLGAGGQHEGMQTATRLALLLLPTPEQLWKSVQEEIYNLIVPYMDTTSNRFIPPN